MTDKPLLKKRDRSTWDPPTEAHPCSSCDALVPCTSESLAAIRKLQHPDELRIFVCGDCARKRREREARDNRTRVDRVARLIRELKATRSPEREREILRHLEALGHPDIKGLTEAIATSRMQGKGPRATRGDA